MLSHKMSIEEKIVRFFYDRKFLNRIVFQELIKDPSFSGHKVQSVRNTLSKLVKKGVLRTGADGIMLGVRGRKYIEEKMERLQYFDSPFSKTAQKDLLVLFDIPEDRKAEREWFRKQLREFGYEMIQRSIWLGPSPLPKEFLEYIKTIGLQECIKTFKLARAQRNLLKEK